MWRQYAVGFFREKLDLLRLAFIEDDEIVFGEPRYGLALLASDNDTNLNEPGSYSQNRSKWFRGLWEGGSLGNSLDRKSVV